MSSPGFPAAALDWLFANSDGPMLALGASAAPLVGYASALVGRVIVCDSGTSGAARLRSRVPQSLPVVAKAHQLPFVPCYFDTVLIHQAFHSLPPTALDELARVLCPGGRLALSYTTRDDSVPWVRRLGDRMREVDPTAMLGNYGADSVSRLDDSMRFPHVERQSFRLWWPITRQALIDLVKRRFPHLSEEDETSLAEDVGAIYDASARTPDSLLLPYRVTCWRAWVDHSDMSKTLHTPDDGLSISL